LIHFELKKNRSITLWILWVLLGFAVTRQFYSSLSWGHQSWQLTDWLINYAGGFVRRGLPGEVIMRLSAATGVAANHVAIGAALASYLCLVAWFLRNTRRDFPLTLVVSCVVLGFPAYQDSILRKDCLGLLLFIGCLEIGRARMPRLLGPILVNLSACVAILFHETFLFYALLALIFFRRPNEPDTSRTLIQRRVIMLLPALGCFLLAVIFHGTPTVANAVNDSWLPLWQQTNPGDPSTGEPSAAIAALGWSTAQGMSLPLDMLKSGIYQPAAWMCVFMVSLMLMLGFTGRGDISKIREAQVRMSATLLTQLCLISPLFVLGFDYGRWLFFWTASSMILHSMGLRAPALVENTVRSVLEGKTMQRILPHVPVRDWYLLLFGVPVCWSAREFLIASPLGRHIHLISSWF
jgi:hypothetical protein